MKPTCKLVIAVGKNKIVLPSTLYRDSAEAIAAVVESAGAVTWFLPADDLPPLKTAAALRSQDTDFLRRPQHSLDDPAQPPSS